MYSQPLPVLLLNIEIANFTKNTFKYIPWEKIRKIKNIDKFGIRSSTAMNMHKANIIVALSEDTQTLALIYKGEAIAVGSRKSIKETLKSIFTFARKEKEIATHLDELYQEAKKLWLKIDEIFPYYFNDKIATAYDIVLKTGESRPRAGIAYLENIEGRGNALLFELNINETLQGQGIGSAIFKLAIEDYNPDYVKSVWKKKDIYTGGESVNLIEFNNAINKKITELKAVFETPTGKILKNIGFDGTPEIIKKTKEEVIVLFKKKI